MSDIRPELQEIVFLYREQLIGFSEARSGIGAVLPWFADARDDDLDEVEREREETLRELEKARGDGNEVGSDSPFPDEDV